MGATFISTLDFHENSSDNPSLIYCIELFILLAFKKIFYINTPSFLFKNHFCDPLERIIKEHKIVAPILPEKYLKKIITITGPIVFQKISFKSRKCLTLCATFSFSFMVFTHFLMTLLSNIPSISTFHKNSS